MNLSVPFNGQKELIGQISRYPQVKEIYGKLTADFIGGGKNSFQTPAVSKKVISSAIKIAHLNGLEFNYLLNSSCLANKEWSISGKKKIIKLIEWVAGSGADSITVGTPYILELIKKYFPRIKLCISTLAGVNSAQKARYWQDLGAARITLLNLDVNRDFLMIKRIRESVSCQLKLIINSNCLHKCPIYRYHANVASHASQSADRLRGFVIDYCRIQCRYRQIIDPVNFIKSTWIRPEDVSLYEKLGIDFFKIIDRGMSSEKILSIVKSYSKRSYEGNLLDLFPSPPKTKISAKKDLFYKAVYFFRPFTANIFKLKKLAELHRNSIYIDNKKMDGFLEKLAGNECSEKSCQDCGYCNKVSGEVIRIPDLVLHKKVKERYKDCMEDIVSGGMFSYF